MSTQRYYIKYIPPRSTDESGIDFLHIWLEKHYPNVTYTDVVSDGTAHFGILSGTGDNLSKALSSIQGRFSVTQMDETTFIGVVKRNYNPPSQQNLPPGSPQPPTFEQFMAQFGITVNQQQTLEAYKQAKLALFLEKVRRKFPHHNDLITDLARSIVLITQHYNDLTTQERQQVDQAINTIKTLFPKQDAIAGFIRLVNLMASIFPEYAAKRNQVMNATTFEEVDQVNYD